MLRNGSIAALAAAFIALPGTAHAATATATGTAALSVINQCEVTGATVNLGTYKTTDTWGTVAAALGSFTGIDFTAGSLGHLYLNYGSVTCDAGIPYTLKVEGTGADGMLGITVNGKRAVLEPHVKQLGQVTLPDQFFDGAGPVLNAGRPHVGDGVPQAILGSALIWTDHGTATALLTDTLGVAGTYTDALTYTLDF